MAGFLRRRNDRARAYADIKDRLLDGEYSPGQQIPVTAIADSLNIRSAPLREACYQLDRERWAIQTRRHGLLAWHPHPQVIPGLYTLTSDVLTTSLMLSELEPAGDSGQQGIQRVHEKLSGQAHTLETIAIRTGELFFAIVALSNDRTLMKEIRRCNYLLRHLRIRESRYLGVDANELLSLCDFALAGRREDLEQAIVTYHETRRDFLPKLVSLLRQ